MTIEWKRSGKRWTGTATTRHHTYQFTVESSLCFPGQWSVASTVTVTATGAIVAEGYIGSAGSAAACKRTAAWNLETGGPRLDAAIEAARGGAR